MTELLHAPGFLGTRANWAADVTLILMLCVGILFNIGFYLARKQKYEAHRWVQTTGALLNLVLVLWLMVLPYRDFVVRDQGGPRDMLFYVITSIHALIGFCAVVFGWFVVLRGNGLMVRPLRFNNYRPYMRVAYGLYMAAILAGIIVYLTWFVIIPAEQLPVYASLVVPPPG